MLKHCVEGCCTLFSWSLIHWVLINQSRQTILNFLLFGWWSFQHPINVALWSSDNQLVPCGGVGTKVLDLVFSHVEEESTYRNLSDSADRENTAWIIWGNTEKTNTNTVSVFGNGWQKVFVAECSWTKLRGSFKCFRHLDDCQFISLFFCECMWQGWREDIGKKFFLLFW